MEKRRGKNGSQLDVSHSPESIEKIENTPPVTRVNFKWPRLLTSSPVRVSV